MSDRRWKLTKTAADLVEVAGAPWRSDYARLAAQEALAEEIGAREAYARTAVMSARWWGRRLRLAEARAEYDDFDSGWGGA